MLIQLQLYLLFYIHTTRNPNYRQNQFRKYYLLRREYQIRPLSIGINLQCHLIYLRTYTLAGGDWGLAVFFWETAKRKIQLIL